MASDTVKRDPTSFHQGNENHEGGTSHLLGWLSSKQFNKWW